MESPTDTIDRSRPVAPLAPQRRWRCAVHRGSDGALDRGFYRAAIRSASKYCRATGFFSSSVFSIDPSAFQDFFAAGGIFQVVCSPFLPVKDLVALRDGLIQPLPASDATPPTSSGPDLLRWAVARNQLEMKIALVHDNESALYHEKFGLFFQDGEPALAFEGSANETRAAIQSNFERVTLYSIHDPFGASTAQRLMSEFNHLWNGTTAGLTVLPVDEAFRRNALRPIEPTAGIHVPNTARNLLDDNVMPPELLRLPGHLKLRQYQLEAIAKWQDNNGRAILEMATGSGKTITALAAAASVYSRCGPPLVIIVVAPFLHLVNQWAEEATAFGLRPVNCSGGTAWERFAQAAILRCNAQCRPITSLVTTNATFCTPRFQSLVDAVAVRTVLIVDEVHNLGAAGLSQCLPDRVSLRLGLSATPQRWNDPVGTRRLHHYFGPVAFQFTLRDALQHHPPVLTQYRYYPVIVSLEPDEHDSYLQLTRAIARFTSEGTGDPLSDIGRALLIKRSRLLASARQKLPALAQAMKPFASSIHNLVYCGDSTVEFPETSAMPDSPLLQRQIDAVTSLLGHELGMAVAQFTAATRPETRLALLNQFGRGDIQALVAIRCLDEGVDIPQISRAFILASTTNPRQFIQRRGRILRRAQGKEVAEIYDFVVSPPRMTKSSKSDPAYRIGRRLVRAELARVREFADLAQNRHDARAVLMPLLREWDLLQFG